MGSHFRRDYRRSEPSDLQETLLPSYQNIIQDDRIPILNSNHGQDSNCTQTEPVVAVVGIRALELTDRRHRKMARHCCLRIFSTLLHAVNAVAAGLFALYALAGALDDKECLPPLVDSYGDPIKFTSLLPTVCTVAHSFIAAISVLNLAMCIGVNCCLESACLRASHIFLSVGMCICAVFAATVFYVHYMLWCDTLVQRGTFEYTSLTCKSAVEYYDYRHHTTNMTWYFKRLEIQQIGLWTISSLMLLTIFACLIVATVVSGSNESSNNSDANTSGNFRYIPLSGEQTPLTDLVGSVSTSSSSSPDYLVRDSHYNRPPPPSYQAHRLPTRRTGGQNTPQPLSRASIYGSAGSTNPFENDSTLEQENRVAETSAVPRHVATYDGSRLLTTESRPPLANETRLRQTEPRIFWTEPQPPLTEPVQPLMVSEDLLIPTSVTIPTIPCILDKPNKEEEPVRYSQLGDASVLGASAPPLGGTHSKTEKLLK